MTNHTYIIAEAGVNHNGDINLAYKLIDKAKEAGVDAVKFQTYISENDTVKYCEKAEYQKTNDSANNQFDLIKKLELSFEDFIKLKNYCNKVGITFLSTPFDLDSLYNKNIKYALEKINGFGIDSPLVLFVINSEGAIVGTLTDGDIRRGLVNGVSTEECIVKVMKKDFRYFSNLNDYEKFNEYKNLDLKIVPLVDKNQKLMDLINLTKLRAMLPLDAVIMAGGKGVRLKPYTNDVPKPMLELAGKPIIAHNIDRLLTFGVRNIYISVNHIKEQIINYINQNYNGKNITFIEENEPLGTIGSVKLVENFKHDDILVMNADILTNIDFYDFFMNYKNFKDDMSVATFNIRINIPYGIFDTSDKKINSLIEKPSFNYYSNAGIYLFKKDVLKYIPENSKFDSTELMERLIEESKKVSHFPIRGYWLDIGNAQNYAKAQDDIRFIKF